LPKKKNKSFWGNQEEPETEGGEAPCGLETEVSGVQIPPAAILILENFIIRAIERSDVVDFQSDTQPNQRFGCEIVPS